MKFLVTIAFLGSLSAWANPNACDDYTARHYKKDLRLEKITFVNKTHMGDIRFPHQQVKLTVKNIGQVDFKRTSGQLYRNFWVKIKNKVIKTRFRLPLNSGQKTIVYVNVKPKTLSHCKSATVELDIGHKAGQWGCQVWNNDKKTLRTTIGNRNCRIIRPHLPNRPIRPIFRN